MQKQESKSLRCLRIPPSLRICQRYALRCQHPRQQLQAQEETVVFCSSHFLEDYS